jgi:protein SCO1/2
MLKAFASAHLEMILAGALVLAPVFAFARDDTFDGKVAPTVSSERPEILQGVGIDEQMGKNLDLNLMFKDENGKTVALGSFYDGKTPVMISPVYYSCPGLCNFHLNGMVDALKNVDWPIGGKFKMLAISFDPKEGPDLAAKKKATYIKLYGKPEAAEGWHFLTADAATITTFMKSVGFNYRWNPEVKEWAHTSAAIVTSPQGKITRYLPGIMFEPKDIKLALNEATSGKIGTFVDSLVLYCFKYDPHQSKYTLYAFNVMKMGGGLMVLLLGLWLIPVWVRSRREGNGSARS